MSARILLAVGALAVLASCVSAPRAPAARAPEPHAADPDLARHPVVHACVDAKGALVSTEIAHSSGIPEIDAAALKVAQASRFTPGTDKGKEMPLSCVNFRVKFVLKDGERVPVESGRE